MATMRRAVARSVQKRCYRPQGIAIPEEHMPPLEGTAEFDMEVNDYYTLKLNQSFWKKQLHAKFMHPADKEALRERVGGKQVRFSKIRRHMVKLQEADQSKKAAALITKQYSEKPPRGAPFAKGDRILPVSGPMKDQVATVLGYRDGLLWYQFDTHTHPIPTHPSAVRQFVKIGSCPLGDTLPDAPESKLELATGAPIKMPSVKSEDASAEELQDPDAPIPPQATEGTQADAEKAKEAGQPGAEQLKESEPKAEEPKAPAEEAPAMGGEEPKAAEAEPAEAGEAKAEPADEAGAQSEPKVAEEVQRGDPAADAKPEKTEQPEAAAEELEKSEPKAPAEEVKAPVDEPKAPSEEPKAPAEEPKAPADEATAPVDEPKASVDEPKAAVEELKTPAEEAKAPTEEPKAPADEVTAPVDEPKASVEEPKTPAEELKEVKEPAAEAAEVPVAEDKADEAASAAAGGKESGEGSPEAASAATTPTAPLASTTANDTGPADTSPPKP